MKTVFVTPIKNYLVGEDLPEKPNEQDWSQTCQFRPNQNKKEQQFCTRENIV
jgi:hypothetical protein